MAIHGGAMVPDPIAPLSHRSAVRNCCLNKVLSIDFVCL